MNREQKAAVIEEVATQIRESEAIFALDYRGLSVQQAVDLRARLGDAGASFRVVKNRLARRAADEAGVEALGALLQGPTAFTFVRGDAATAAKALAGFRREHQVLEFKGGTMEGAAVTIDQIELIARLPARDVLQSQFVGVLAAPLTGLVRGLGALISGLAIALGQVQEKGLLGGGASAGEADAAVEEKPVATPEPAAEETAEASPEPAAEVEPQAPAEGDGTETKEN